MSNAIQMRIRDAVAMEVTPSTGMFVCRRRNKFPLTLGPSYLEKSESDSGDWQKVRLMPALLRIFTRVNLLVMVGEEQGMICSHALLAKPGLTSGPRRSRSPRSLRRYHGLLLELCERFPRSYSCPSLSLPVSILSNQPRRISVKLIDVQTYRSHVGRLGYCQTKGLQASAATYMSKY